MIRRIVLDNFMSHSHTVIEPAEGLTVLSGPNNCGKSAVVVALQTLCGQHAGDFMVRHGQKECQVQVETDDGHLIRWRRKGAVVSYNIDGQDYHRLQRQVPDELQPLLRLPEVSDPEGNASFDVHFADQKQPIFLLDKSGRQAALFFASSSDAALLIEMQRRHKDKTRDAKTQDKHLAGEVEHLAQQVALLEPIETIDTALVEIEKTFEHLRQESEQLTTLADQIDRIDRQAAERHRAAERAAALADLSPPPPLQDVQSLESLCRAMAAQESLLRASASRAAALESLIEPPALHDTATLAGLVSAMHSAAAAREWASRRVGTLADVPTVPDLADTLPLADQIRQQVLAEASVAKCRGDLARSIVEGCQVEQAIRAWVQVNPICRLCGQAIDPDALISAGGHSHAQG